MTDFVFDDFARATLAGARHPDGTALTAGQADRLIDYLKTPGSGPDGTTSYSEYVDKQLTLHPAKLPPGKDYVAYSGIDSDKVSNFDNANQYILDTGRTAGVIADTPWGKFVNSAPSDPEFVAIEGKFKSAMQAENAEPYGGSHRGALQDMMWNAGSPQYFENAIAAQKQILAFVENAPPGRGFSTFELPTAMASPDTVINGYPVDHFKSDPLAFASKSAAEYQALEKSVADSASITSGWTVTVQDLRSSLKLIDGYDAVNKTLFSQPVETFKTLSFGDMKDSRAHWTNPESLVPVRALADQNPTMSVGERRADQLVNLSREDAMKTGDDQLRIAWANLDSIKAIVGRADPPSPAFQAQMIEKATQQMAAHLREGKELRLVETGPTPDRASERQPKVQDRER